MARELLWIGGMFTDVMIELWIVALAAIVNGTVPRIHADVAEAVARHRARDRPQA